MPDTYHLICYVLGALFLWAGWLNLLGPAFIAEEFTKWKYPSWLRVSVGIAEWAIAGMLFLQVAPRAAIVMAGAIIAAVLITLIRDRQLMRLDLPILVAALLAIVYPLSPALGSLGN